MGVPPGLPVHVLIGWTQSPFGLPKCIFNIFYQPRLRQDWDHESLFHKMKMIIQYRYNMKMTNVIKLVHSQTKKKKN